MATEMVKHNKIAPNMTIDTQIEEAVTLAQKVLKPVSKSHC
jgi:hypothetical protein